MSSAAKKILLAVVVVLLVVFLVLQGHNLMHPGGFSVAKLLGAIREAKLPYLALAVLTIYTCYALRSLRWLVLQRNLGPSSYANILKMTFAGFGAIFLLGRAGEPIRPLLIARKEQLPIADIFGIYVVERILDIASTAVIAAVALLLFESHVHAGQNSAKLQTAVRTAGLLLGAGTLFAVGLLVYLRLHGTAFLEARLKHWTGAPGWRSKVAGMLLGFARGVQTIRTFGDLFLVTVYSGLHWFLVAVVYFIVLRSFSATLPHLGLGDAMLVLAFTLLGSAVQLPAVGGGSQLASFLVLTSVLNVDAEPATVAALTIWMITFGSCALVGVPLLLHQGLSLGQLRALGKEEVQEEEGLLPEGATVQTMHELDTARLAARTAAQGDPRE